MDDNRSSRDIIATQDQPVPADRARQGITPGVVRYMLAASLAMAVLAMLLVYALG